ncbi:receptor kinase-like protein Xa21 [Zingiber officinale]|uniref:Receptor kinase-like protein Xa21 n=1 Tax=Zingiber officinale TaxID=94328 RepID=A0A8J5KRV3_ZINOF|nr:receptor kinase-like protein Xa21 [Zingiber officinale]KAG6490324.1 hypothetical protein ZIOFF_051613 [Zingiber officinale]
MDTRRGELKAINLINPKMRRLPLLPALRIWFFLFASTAAKARITPSSSLLDSDDAAALLDFKEKLGGGGTSLLSWNGSTHFCTWQGVTCGRRHPERVTGVDLSAGGLVGPISPSIGNLSFLRSLNLSSNALYGEIPSSVSHLRHLSYLDLYFNSISGEIPSGLGNCSELRSINLCNNQLVGGIPPGIGFLTRLEALDLRNNSITGVIPSSLTNASSLTALKLSFNHIEDVIPERIGHLAQLQFLQVSRNNLSGIVPTSFYNLTSLSVFSVAENQLHGELPADFGSKLRNLKSLLLDNNQFTGPIPASITNCSILEKFDVSYNNFNGRMPPNTGRLTALTLFSIGGNQIEAQTADDWDFFASLANCSELKQVYVFRNNLGGVLPPAVANFSDTLQHLTMDKNAISGSIPSGIGNLVGLEELMLGENHLIGGIPEEIGHLKQLMYLSLLDNLLSGPLPSSLGNLTQLNFLVLAYNALQGPIPATLGSLQSMNVLSLSNNFFDGVIPKELVSLPFMSNFFDLGYNLLTGSLPLEVGNLKNVRNFFVSGNRLQGEIPSTLGECEVLENLGLDDNSFQGSIPSTLGKIVGLKAVNLTNNNLSGEIPQTLRFITGLEQLYLSHNNLSGAIPQFLQDFSFLFAIDLSFNRLEGAVPTKGIFQNITGMRIDGNNGLCGGVQDLHLPACPTQHPKRKRSKLFPLLIAMPILFLALLLVISLVCCRKNRKKPSAISYPIGTPYPTISYAELSRSTAGFDSANLIGRGRYGSVYKATIDSENRIVAVKVFDLQQSGSSRSFLAECEALSRIRHRNLVKVVTCCSSIDSNGDDFKALVFDFMPNKSLDRWLHPHLEDDSREHGEVSNLSLVQRLSIAIDVAEALDYLHNHSNPPIVHCDLKPSNILLDEDMVAHVGDFGLAKLLPEAISKSLANSTNSIGLRGSIGYVPPEYGEGSPVSTSGDVYSFGVLLLELLTGKSPVDDMFKEGLTLIRFVEMRGAMEIADPSLLLCDNAVINWWDIVEECSTSLSRISFACTKQTPRDRMSAGAVVAELHAIKEEFVKKTKINEEQNR